MVDYRQKYRKIPKERGCFLTQHILRNMNQLRMRRGSTGKSFASPGGTEAIVWNRCSCQIPTIFGTNTSTNEKHKLYNSTFQAISRGGGYCATNVGSLCAVLLIWDPQLKIRQKIGSVTSLVYGARPFICLTKPFLS